MVFGFPPGQYLLASKASLELTWEVGGTEIKGQVLVMKDSILGISTTFETITCAESFVHAVLPRNLWLQIPVDFTA